MQDVEAPHDPAMPKEFEEMTGEDLMQIPPDRRPPLQVRVRQGANWMTLTEGQTLRRCVQKGWLWKKSATGMRRHWKQRYFRVVVHTEVKVVSAVAMGLDPAETGPKLLDEVITAAWLLYYEDDKYAGDAKATIDLEGTVAQGTSDAAIQTKYGDAFEIFHPRRRVYQLRPVHPSEGFEPVPHERGSHWIATINAAVSSLGKLFTLRFRRSTR